MPTHLLARRRHKPRPALSLMEGIALARGRAHEVCGPARHSFALWLAAAAQKAAPGPVLWLALPQAGRPLNPDGMAEFASPARFLFLTAASSADLLWAMEESLRSGAAPLVVAELPEPPAMTPVRRLHLAAEAGGGLGPAPLGLMLTPGEGGAPGIESRWHLSPAHAPLPPLPLAKPRTAGTGTCWTLQRLRARTLPPPLRKGSQDAAGGPPSAGPAPTPPPSTPPSPPRSPRPPPPPPATPAAP
ncbi:hypothetical protein, partial [Leisingera sp. ANG-Vp]|uniref:hypothetical protein n=1 Tax=Leisingera sp. ANG-Vp TaxID=1577896 RepID=UPI00187CE60D